MATNKTTAFDALRAQCEALGAELRALHTQVDEMLAGFQVSRNDPALVVPMRSGRIA